MACIAHCSVYQTISMSSFPPIHAVKALLAPKCPSDGVHRVKGSAFLYRWSNLLICIGLPRCSPSKHHYSPFSTHNGYIMRACLTRSSLSAHSSCFIPLHCKHTTLKEVPKHFPRNIVAQRVIVVLLLVTIIPISSVLYPVKVSRVCAAPMLSVREATNATTRQLEPAATCQKDLPCLLSHQKTPTSR